MGTSMTARGSRTQTRPVLTALVPFSASSITTVSLTYIYTHTIDINPIFLSSHQSNALKSCPLSKRPTTSVSKQSVVSVHLTRAPALPGTVLHPPPPEYYLVGLSTSMWGTPGSLLRFCFSPPLPLPSVSVFIL